MKSTSRTPLTLIVATSFCFLPVVATRCAEPPVKPLLRVHAHNDYEHQRPLFDALDHGFCSVEADIYLVDGQLLVAHDRDKVDPQKTLQSLYLEPLRERIRRNAARVYSGGPDCTLLIDVKSDAARTYPVLNQVLKDYADILTVFSSDQTRTGAITAIITGNRPTKLLAAETVRYAAVDGQLGDLDSNASNQFFPWISDNWSQTFRWRGVGPISEAERTKLHQIVAKAHLKGRKVRFWGAPDFPAFWRELLSADVDLINTDDLAGAQAFLLNNDPPSPAANRQDNFK